MVKHTVDLDLYYSGSYHSQDIYERGLTVRRGTTRAGADSDPGQAPMALDNRSGDLAPRNITGNLYGKIGQNTRARVTLDSSVRLTGEVASWEPTRDISGDAWTSILVAGVLQRIGRGTDPLLPPLTRAITANNPDVFWPLDDPEGSMEAGSGIGGTPMLVTGPVDFGEYTDLAGTTRAPNVQTGSLRGTVAGARAAAASNYSFSFGFAVKTVVKPQNDPSTFIPLAIWHTPGSAIVRWELLTSILELGEYTLQAIEPDGTNWFYSLPIPFFNVATISDQWHYFEVSFSFISATKKYNKIVWVDGVLVEATTGTTVYSVNTQSGITAVDINPQRYDFTSLGLAGMWVKNGTSTIAGIGAAADGYSGEKAADRFERLMSEQGIPSVVVGTNADTVAMGPQRTITLLGLLDEIGRTDDASIFETRTALGLTMRTGASKLNQAADLTVSYLGDIVPPLRPVLGDAGIRNDVTASSPGGGMRRVQQLTGPHNVQLPEVDPLGVGRYTTRVDVNPELDSALADAAGWRVNQGTFDGTWYMSVTVDHDAAPWLTPYADALDIGDVIAVTDLPVDEALDTVALIIIGIEDNLPATHRRTTTFFCIPAAPYMVGLLANTSGDTDPVLGHLDTDGSTTNGAIAANAATFSVTTTSGPIWTTAADDFPFDVVVGGQRVSISSISGAASPQTFTVATYAGRFPVAYAIASGSAVNVHQPIILSL